MKKRLLSVLMALIGIIIPTNSWAQEPYAVLSDNNTVLTFYYDDQKAARNGMDIGPFGSESDRPWHEMSEHIENVIIDSAITNDTTITSTAYWFKDFTSLKNIDGVQWLNTKFVTDMRQMFQNCSALTGLILDSFNTTNVTTMHGMFYGCSNLQTLKLGNFNTDKVTDTSYMFEGCSSLTEVDLSSFTEVKNPYRMFNRCSNLTSLDLSTFKTNEATLMRDMFEDCSKLTTLDLSSFQTEQVTDMYAMFARCSSLKTIYVGSGWTTSNVTDSGNMFSDCTNLVGGMGTVFTYDYTDATYAHIDGGAANPGYFTDKTNIIGEAIDLGLPSGTKWASWNVGASKPEEFGGYYAWGETEEKDTYTWENYQYGSYNYDDGSSQMVDIGSDIGGTDYDVAHLKWQGDWRLPSLEHINELRNNCSYEWTTLNGVNGCRFTGPNGNSIFLPAAGRWYNGTLESVGSYGDYQSSTKREPESGESISVFSEGLLFNSEICTWSYANPVWGQYCGRCVRPIIPGTPQNDPEPYAVLSDNNTVLTFYYDDQKAARNGMSVGPFVYDDEKGWYVANSTIETVVFDASFAACSSITSTAHWFERLHSLTTITGMTNLNTSNVTNMERMFRQCINLTSLDMSSFNTSNVTNMSELFEDCSGLTSLDVSGFNTSNVTDLSWMFSGCTGLTSLDVSGFDTSKATDMDGMFERCSSLTSIDVSHLKTDNVTTMEEMFERCSSLTSLDVSAFNTSNVTSMEYMFGRCHGLTTLDLSTFNTAKVTNMSNMFRENTGLTSLNLSNFNTSNVTVMEYMFNSCPNITTLDLSSFNTAKVEDMDGMFGDCSALTTIYVGNNWTTANVENSYEMFAGCNNLVGGAGTQYNESHIDHTYAHIDGGTANPGYFTAINGTNSEAWFDGLTAYVMGEATLDDAFAQTGGRSEAAKTIAAIVWEGNTALTADMLQGINNPNLLVYVSEPSMAPQGVQNVVINGQAKEIILTDVTSGNNNFFCPEPFWAEKISYTRNFQQRSEIGVSRGWEGIALPFNVQTITHETHGALAPFAAGDHNAKPFWLRYYTGDKVESAHEIEAYVPYIIAMPNSNDYFPEYNQAGRVTFSAINTEVYETPDFSFMEHEPNMQMMTIPTFQLKAKSDSIYAINVGQPRNNYAEGSVFESGLRDVRPFEIYTVHHGQGARPRFIPIPVQGNESNGIADIKVTEPTDHSQWYDLSGRKLSGEPMSKGIYIHKGQKVKKMKK